MIDWIDGSRDASGPEDSLLIEGVAALADRLRAGETIDLEGLNGLNPGRADALRRLLPAMALMAGFGAPGPGRA